MLRARAGLAAMPAGERRARLDDWSLFRDAGMTWEDVPAWLDAGGDGRMDAAAWEAIIPHMGLFALARNLRNFDEAGVSDTVAARIVARFADPEQVARSRMFPYRWLAAYDAAIFGVALALRNPAQTDLIGFATGSFRHRVRNSDALLRLVRAFTRAPAKSATAPRSPPRCAPTTRATRGCSSSATCTMDSGVSSAVPARVPVYGMSLGGYRPTVIPGRRPAALRVPGTG
jgi:hypothetical protein